MATDQNKTDGERLTALFEAHKAQTGMTRREFAKRYEMPGGQSVISQHIAGLRPISIKQAKAYMTGFGCKLADISPSLAAEYETLADPAPAAPSPKPPTIPHNSIHGRTAAATSAPYSPRLATATSMLNALDPDLLEDAIQLIEVVHAKQLARRKLATA